MSKKSFIILIVLYMVVLSKQVFAHSASQPPFFKINSQYTNLYAVPLTSLQDFNLPQDMAPQNYLINQPLQFELDENKLPAPPEIVKKTKFNWDFGDGTKRQGLITDHIYTQMGSYILDVYADDGTTPTPQLIEKVLLNILPNSSYQPPQAIIKINGKISKDPLTDILEFKFDEELKFDGTTSQTKSSKIVSYFWDFGDQQSNNKPLTTHSYPKDLTQVFPVLRVKDENGFISDSFVEVQNQNIVQDNVFSNLGNKQSFSSNKPLTNDKKSDTTKQLKYSIMGLGILLGVICITSIFMKRKKKI